MEKVEKVLDGGGSTKFGWLVNAFTMDDVEGALDRCNNSAPRLDGIKGQRLCQY
jgi:hypothetical protein